MESRTVKGSHVLMVKTWVDERLGPGSFGRYVGASDERWRIILPMVWYDIDVMHTALKQACEQLGVSVLEAQTAIARRNAEADLTSIYRFFMRVAQPQRLLTQTPRLWRTYVDFGNASAVKNERGHYVGQGDGFDQYLMQWACGSWAGFIPTAIELAGGREVRWEIVKQWRTSNGKYSLQLEVHYG